ncbi:MAG: biliverdin-producing heme oxygenase [Cyanobacteria bacterium J06648_16]
MRYPLALSLREGTQHAHALAENTVLMKCLFQGVVEREPIRLWLSRLYYIYEALEVEMQRSTHCATVRTMYFPSLERLPQLEKDLAFYFGENWHHLIQPSPKTIRYVMRIHAIANDAPELLIAHAYVRYMGDLSGGQGLKSAIRPALTLPVGEGTAFYEFSDLPTVRDRHMFKHRYRDALNSLSLDKATLLQVVHEANLAFKLNYGLLQELEPAVKAAIGQTRFALIAHQGDLPSSTAHSPTHRTQLVMTGA